MKRNTRTRRYRNSKLVTYFGALIALVVLPTFAQAQVTSVSQLRDVFPTDIHSPSMSSQPLIERPQQVKSPIDGNIEIDPILIAPDLVVDRFEQYGEAIQVGSQLHVPIKVKVHNKSLANINEKVFCAIRVGDEFVWSTFMMPLEGNMADIAIGMVKFDYVPENNPSGQITLVAVVDAPLGTDEIPVEGFGRVLEHNEFNNERSIVVRVASDGDIDSGHQIPAFPGDINGEFPGPEGPRPDLRIDLCQLTSHVRYSGEFLEVPFRARIRNQGEAPAVEHSVFGARFHVKLIWTSLIAPLQPGEAAYSQGTLRILDPDRKYAGAHINVVCTADAAIGPDEIGVAEYGRVLEANEDNNQAMLTFQVPKQATLDPQALLPINPNPNFEFGGSQQQRPRPKNNEFHTLPWYGNPGTAMPRPRPGNSRTGTGRPTTQRPQTTRPAPTRPGRPSWKIPAGRRPSTAKPVARPPSKKTGSSRAPSRRR